MTCVKYAVFNFQTLPKELLRKEPNVAAGVAVLVTWGSDRLCAALGGWLSPPP